MSNTRQNTIKSFVLRTGRITKAQKKAFDLGWQRFGLGFNEQSMDFFSLYANSNPVWMEVGFGNGESLYQMASKMPEINFLGVEVHTPGVGHLLSLLNKQPLDNLKIIQHDAMDVLEKMVADNSLSRFLLFFPDPWPKKKHHKRRFVRQQTLSLLAKKLVTGGVWHITTDWQPYAEYCLELFAQSMDFSNLAEKDYCRKPDYRPLTKFEQRGLRLGHQVFDCLFEKVSQ